MIVSGLFKWYDLKNIFNQELFVEIQKIVKYRLSQLSLSYIAHWFLL